MASNEIKISEISDGKTFDDYPDDTLFVLDEESPEDELWEDEE